MTAKPVPGAGGRGHPPILDAVDASSEASFPASDPPSWWAGAPSPAPLARPRPPAKEG